MKQILKDPAIMAIIFLVSCTLGICVFSFITRECDINKPCPEKTKVTANIYNKLTEINNTLVITKTEQKQNDKLTHELIKDVKDDIVVIQNQYKEPSFNYLITGSIIFIFGIALALYLKSNPLKRMSYERSLFLLSKLEQELLDRKMLLEVHKHDMIDKLKNCDTESSAIQKNNVVCLLDTYTNSYLMTLERMCHLLLSNRKLIWTIRYRYMDQIHMVLKQYPEELNSVTTDYRSVVKVYNKWMHGE
jgi:hypothetical protein